MALWGYKIIFKKQHRSSTLNVRLHLKRRPGVRPVQVMGRSNSLPASQPRRPVAASATPPRSRLLKGDTIPINVFLSTSLRCLFNTAPGGFGARTDRVKLHFSQLRERDVTRALQQVQGRQEGPGTAVAVGTSLLGSEINQSQQSFRA